MLTYGFKFASNVTELRVIGMLKEAEDEVNKSIKVWNLFYYIGYFQEKKTTAFCTLSRM